METEDNKRIVEIQGVKLEVDLTTAKVIENYKVGDNVRLLVKSYGDEYKVYPGVIIGFDDFQNLPTITVCYLEMNYTSADVKFAYINEKSKNEVELAPAYDVDDLRFKKSEVMAKLNDEITKKLEEIKDVERKRDYFTSHFDKYFIKEAAES